MSHKWVRQGKFAAIVDPESARLGLPSNLEEVFRVDANHYTMVKFSSQSSSEYRRARDRLKKLQDLGKTAGESAFSVELEHRKNLR